MNDIHPDLTLLAQPERRAICCLCVESAGQNLSGLLKKKPFSRYVENGETALLFDEAQSEAWRMEIERILRENGLCAGMSGPFRAGRFRARMPDQSAHCAGNGQSACARTHAV